MRIQRKKTTGYGFLFSMLLLVVLLVTGTRTEIFAQEYDSLQDYYDEITEESRVYDFAGLLTDSDIENLEKSITKAVKASKLDIVILTVNDNFYAGDTKLADTFFDNGPFGYEEDYYSPSGVLLLVDMGERNVYISTAGIAQLYINDDVIDIILDDITEDATDADYRKLCDEFIEDIVYFGRQGAATKAFAKLRDAWYSGKYQDWDEVRDAKYTEFMKVDMMALNYNSSKITSDRKLDVYNMTCKGFRKTTFFTTLRNPLRNLGIGAIVALIVVLVNLNAAKAQVSVTNRTYRSEKEPEILHRRDSFVRRTTKTIHHESSSGGGGGHSSSGSHHSSGGHSHGGGGRHF